MNAADAVKPVAAVLVGGAVGTVAAAGGGCRPPARRRRLSGRHVPDQPRRLVRARGSRRAGLAVGRRVAAGGPRPGTARIVHDLLGPRGLGRRTDLGRRRRGGRDLRRRLAGRRHHGRRARASARGAATATQLLRSGSTNDPADRRAGGRRGSRRRRFCATSSVAPAPARRGRGRCCSSTSSDRSSPASRIHSDLSLIVVTGFAGGLTTFSTLSVETVQLASGGSLAQRHRLSVALNVAARRRGRGRGLDRSGSPLFGT